MRQSRRHCRTAYCLISRPTPHHKASRLQMLRLIASFATRLSGLAISLITERLRPKLSLTPWIFTTLIHAKCSQVATLVTKSSKSIDLPRTCWMSASSETKSNNAQTADESYFACHLYIFRTRSLAQLSHGFIWLYWRIIYFSRRWQWYSILNSN